MFGHGWQAQINDAGGILFIQVTSQNERVTLYFPVSDDSHTDI